MITCRVVSLLAILAACNQQEVPPAPPPPPPDAVEVDVPMPAPEVAVDDLLLPPWSHPRSREAAARFAAGDWAAARDAIDAVLADELEPGLEPHLRLLRGLCHLHLRAWARAASDLDGLDSELPHLADFVRYRAARAQLHARHLDRAEALARGVTADSSEGPHASMLVGSILRRRGRWREAADHHVAYLTRYPDGPRRSEASYLALEAGERAGDDREDLIGGYRVLAARTPNSRWGKQAKRRAKELIRRLPRARARAWRSPTAAELIEVGKREYRAKRNQRAAAVFERAIDAAGATAATRCEATYYHGDSWFRARKRDRSAPIFDTASVLCLLTLDREIQIKAAFQAGRSYAVVGDWARAAKRFELAEQLAATVGSTYADDARVRHAEAREALGQQARVTELLTSTPLLYPDGDMRAEALWRLAWREYRRRDYPQAITYLRQQLAIKPVEYNYWAEGQALYWLGRAHQQLGHDDDAARAFEDTARAYPLTYYALMALNRLRTGFPDRYRAFVDELPVPAADDAGPALEVPALALLRDPQILRVVDLLRLGLEREAGELSHLAGRDREPGRDPDHDDTQSMWIVAHHLHRSERYPQSHWITRWHALDYRRQWPVGSALAKWSIAYPPGFRELVDRSAEERGYPAALQKAIVREESGFSPNLESWANAIGLTQLLVPTARRFADGLRVNRRTLRDPETNIAIGGNFLAYLWRKWGGMAALVAPSYNAGEGAVTRWLRARPWPTDEWLEAVPADQARNYAKRVLSSYFAYAFLHDGTIPDLPLNAPDGVLPEPLASRAD